jgi:hypothetical protein
LYVQVVEDPVTGASKGHGFVHFETQEAADAAIERVNGMLLAGKKVWPCSRQACILVLLHGAATNLDLVRGLCWRDLCAIWQLSKCLTI